MIKPQDRTNRSHEEKMQSQLIHNIKTLKTSRFLRRGRAKEASDEKRRELTQSPIEATAIAGKVKQMPDCYCGVVETFCTVQSWLQTWYTASCAAVCTASGLPGCTRTPAVSITACDHSNSELVAAPTRSELANPRLADLSSPAGVARSLPTPTPSSRAHFHYNATRAFPAEGCHHPAANSQISGHPR